ncbi:MAG: pectate lyase [Fuerstiella sp.]
MKRMVAVLLTLLLTAVAATLPIVAQTPSQQEAAASLSAVVNFYRSEVGYQGAYLWKYSADLSHQEGEGTATKTSGWTQPPGAPSVGEAFLKAWRLSGKTECLEAAVEVAHALVRAQLKSGGWSSHFDLGAEGRRRYAYRVDGDEAGRDNRTTFDDNKTQSALMLLMHVDEALDFQDATIHEAVQFSLQHILAAQYSNGAWPQQYDTPAAPEASPPIRASYPETWSRTHPKQKYIGHYTFNDGNMSHIVDMLLEAGRIYHRDDWIQGARRTGEFMLLAQLPEPQPGWAQQYNAEMHPAWARKFEPPAITGGEAQGVMRTLLTLYRFTGEKRFIQTLPQALAYYRRSLLPDGRLARFYELRTNRPLYFSRDYQLTYSDADMPTHYAFKVGSGLDRIEAEYHELSLLDSAPERPSHRVDRPVRLTKKVAERGAAVLMALDERAAWVESGHMKHQNDPLPIIDMRTFARNLETLAAFVGARD